MSARSVVLRILLFFILVHLAASVSWATTPGADAWTEANPPAATPTSMFGLLVRLFFSLAFILLLIWGAVWLIRRFSPSRIRSAGVHNLVDVIAQTYIAPKKVIYILRLGDRALAVGATETTLTPLAELDLEETLSAWSEGLSGQESRGLSGILGGLKSRRSKDPK